MALLQVVTKGRIERRIYRVEVTLLPLIHHQLVDFVPQTNIVRELAVETDQSHSYDRQRTAPTTLHSQRSKHPLTELLKLNRDKVTLVLRSKTTGTLILSIDQLDPHQ